MFLLRRAPIAFLINLAWSCVVVPSQMEEIQALLKSKSSITSSVMKGSAWQELECDLLVSKIKRTKTLFGDTAFNELIKPQVDLNTLTYRQGIVKGLVNDTSTHEQMEKIFSSIASHQHDLCSSWVPEDANEKSNIDNLYYHLGFLPGAIDKRLNRSRLALEGACVVDLAVGSVQLLSLLGTGGIADELKASAVQKRSSNLKAGAIHGLMQNITLHSPYPRLYKDEFDSSLVSILQSHGTVGDWYTFCNQGWGLGKPTSAALAAVALISKDFLTLSTIKFSFSRLALLQKTVSSLQHRMVSVAHIFKQLPQLHALVAQHQELFGEKLCHDLDITTKSATMQQLHDLLTTSTFSSPTDYLFFRGRVLLANKLLQEVQDECIALMVAVGEVEAYWAAATWYKEQTEQAPICFVEFAEGDALKLVLEDFWTPLITTANPVLNSIQLGEETCSKMLLTGPNGAGKSTIMKSIAHIILAQSFGVAPARRAILHPFSIICSSICPREDLQNNLSTFMAEKLRMQEISTAIMNQLPHEHSFVLLDEPYRGTVEAEAAYRVCEFGNKMAEYKNCMMVLATHLQAPIALQESGAFVNYQLGLEETDNGFVRTFKLLPGAALWWFQDVQKRHRFVDQLLG